MDKKICSVCRIEKPFSDYFKDNRRKVGIRCKCKSCCKKETYDWRIKNRSEYNNYAAAWRAKNPEKQHASEIKRYYSLSIERYNEMLTKQACKCKICGKDHNPTVKRGRLYVDHNHRTGIVRGLLCGTCNSGVGYFEDSIDILKSAIKYLESF